MILEIVAIISDVSIIIPLFLIFFNLKKCWNYYNRFFLINIIILVGLIFVRNLITEWLTWNDIDNIYVYNWYNYLSFLTITSIYFVNEKNKYIRILYWGLWITFTYITFYQSDYLFDTTTIYFHRASYNFSHGFITIIVLVFFYNLIANLQVPVVTKYPLFWFSAGILFYYAGTFFLFLLIQDLYKNSAEIQKMYWMIDALLSILMNALIAVTICYMAVPAKASK